ncbi:MAG: acyl-CoA dehydrogenase family protein [Deltaproteobacteria bacterium]|nr:acyl-CoA dehydrogenase family protein [Deltaproteobacteria bacterium]MBW2446312.1 acyl-CoA dehydrogenase family protein [Deltaproteobacteria bacterium]
MIDFTLSPELTLLQSTARELARDRLAAVERRLEADRDVGDELRRLFDEVGLARVELPEALGGAELGALARAVVLEELGAGDPGAALALDPLGPAAYVVQELGGSEALTALAKPILAEPGARALLVHDHRPRFHESGGTVQGQFPWVPADRVDLLVVLEMERAYVVREGIHLEPVRGAGLRAAGASELRLDGAPIVESWVSTPATLQAHARGRLYVASLLVGVLRRAYEYSRDYALERVAFGRPIAHHQSLAFLIADMATAVDGCRMLVHEAAWRLDQGDPAVEACAGAFVECCEQAMFVTPNALQLLGGHGFMLDHPVEKFMRDARALTLLLGGVDAAREESGRDLGERDGPVALTLGESSWT